MEKKKAGRSFGWTSPCKECKHRKKKNCSCGVQLRWEWLNKQKLVKF
jgi:hypothetical protein